MSGARSTCSLPLIPGSIPRPRPAAPNRQNAIFSWRSAMPRQIDRSKVVVFFGLTGSGKSYLGKRWAAERGYPCFNSDQVRKELAGVAPESRHHVPFNEGVGSPDMTRQTYDEMALRALTALRDNKA